MKYWIFVITLLCTALVQAKMYQWVDDKGRTHFSDKPPASILEKPSATKTTAHVPTKSKSNNISKGSGRSSSAR